MPSGSDLVPDSSGRSYDLTFPSGLTVRQVVAWLHALSGTLPSGLSRLWGAPTTVFELWATGGGRGFRYRLTASRTYADYLVGQLRTLVPGTRVVPVTDEPERWEWTRAVELGMRARSRTLRIIEPESVSTSLLAAVQGVALRPGDTLLYQWVIRPAVPEHPPQPLRRGEARPSGPFGSLMSQLPTKDQIADQRAKLDGVTFLGVLRIGVRTATATRAGELLSAVRAALLSTQTAANTLHTRFVRQRQVQQRLAMQHAPFLFPIHLTATELASLLAWPLGEPRVAGLPHARTRQLPATGAIPRSGGPIVMYSDFPGDERPLCITPADLTTHTLIAGRTGTGKTTLLCGVAEQLVRNNYGLVLIETKGDETGQTLFHAVLERIPQHRVDDCIIVDVGDQRYATGYSVLDDGNPRIAVEHLCSLFDHLYRDRGVYSREAFYHGLMTLVARPGYSFVDLVPLFDPKDRAEEAWRDELVASLRDPELQDFWRRFQAKPKAEQARFAQPLIDRAWMLSSRPEIRRIVGQSRSAFSLREALEQHKIVLINLSGVGEATALLAGTLLTNSLWSAIKTARVDRPNFVFLDEWASLLDLGIAMDELLSRARGYSAGLFLATQHPAGLPMDIRGTAITNCASQLVFAGGSEDARLFAREFGGAVSEDDFRNLGRFQVIARVAAGGETHGPVTGVTTRPSRPTGLADQVRAASRRRYGRPVAEVEQEIRQRREPTQQPRKRPTIGTQEWS